MQLLPVSVLVPQVARFISPLILTQDTASHELVLEGRFHLGSALTLLVLLFSLLGPFLVEDSLLSISLVGREKRKPIELWMSNTLCHHLSCFSQRVRVTMT